jgi:hypothetical protein
MAVKEKVIFGNQKGRLFLVAGLILCWAIIPLRAEDNKGKSPFCDLPISEETRDIRKAFIIGDLEKMKNLLAEANPRNPANRAMDLGAQVTATNLVDPLSALMHTHDFVGGQLGAFIPNGNEDPVKLIKQRADDLARESPQVNPHIADALCLAIALQLVRATKEDRLIALDDEILFSKNPTKAPRELFKTLACEVLCSHESARKRQGELIRVMFNQKIFQMEKTPFFRGGLWIQVKQIASALDPKSQDRWEPVFLDIASECAAKMRYASGALVIIYGAHLGQQGAWQYLHGASEAQKETKNARGITNLKIAFAYLCEMVRTFDNKLPDEKDEVFGKLIANLESLGVSHETQYAMEAAGLGKKP